MNQMESQSQPPQPPQPLIPDVTVLQDLPTDGITGLQYLHRPPDRPEELLASTSWDGHVRIHNTTTRSCVLDHYMNSGPLLSFTVLQQAPRDSNASNHSQLATSLVTGGCDGSIRQLDIETSKMTLIGKHTNDNHKNSMDSSINTTNQFDTAAAPVACSCLGSIYNPNIVISAGWHQQLHVWDIRTSSSTSSSQGPTTLPQPQHTVHLPGKAFAMDINPSRANLVAVATSGRRNCFIDLRYTKNHHDTDGTLLVEDCTLILDRESSLKYQTRCLQFFPSGDRIVLGSIEGRAAVEFLDDVTPLEQQRNRHDNSNKDGTNSNTGTKFSFKCHRINDMVYPVNAVACHPLYGTFATGGCDGTVGKVFFVCDILCFVCLLFTIDKSMPCRTVANSGTLILHFSYTLIVFLSIYTVTVRYVRYIKSFGMPFTRKRLHRLYPHSLHLYRHWHSMTRVRKSRSHRVTRTKRANGNIPRMKYMSGHCSNPNVHRKSNRNVSSNSNFNHHHVAIIQTRLTQLPVENIILYYTDRYCSQMLFSVNIYYDKVARL